MTAKNEFSIRDLESITGIKAHTIRIWEQRYGLLNPLRSDTNIRSYSGNDLRKLLNITLLQRHGMKISRIALLPAHDIEERVATVVNTAPGEQSVMHRLKLSMMEYNESGFRSCCADYLKSGSFEQLFFDVFVPFLNHIGFLWQSGSICPANEHFISNLIRQFIFHEIQQLPLSKDKIGRTIVLFLPDGEIHEVSLLMMHYLSRKAGHQSVYLGASVPTEDIEEVANKLTGSDFIALSVTHPNPTEVRDYIERLAGVAETSKCKFHLCGGSFSECRSNDRVQVYPSLREALMVIS